MIHAWLPEPCMPLTSTSQRECFTGQLDEPGGYTNQSQSSIQCLLSRNTRNRRKYESIDIQSVHPIYVPIPLRLYRSPCPTTSKKAKRIIMYSKTPPAAQSGRSINKNTPPVLFSSVLRSFLSSDPHRKSDGEDSLLLLLIHVRRDIPWIIVHMHISALNRRHTLKHILQAFA